MPLLTTEELKKQLTLAEADFENAKATLFRMDGVVRTFKHLIELSEKPEEKKDE